MPALRRHLRAVAITPLVLCCVAATPGPTQGPGGASQVQVILVEGWVRAPRPTDTGATDLWLQHRGKTYRLQVTRVRIVSGPGTGSEILSRVAAFRPNLILSGSDAMIGRLDTAQPHEAVEITGYFRNDTRTLLVTEVSVTAAPTAAPASTPSEVPVPTR